MPRKNAPSPPPLEFAQHERLLQWPVLVSDIYCRVKILTETEDCMMNELPLWWMVYIGQWITLVSQNSCWL